MHDADGVADETMLAFARETKLSETTFVQSSSDGDYRNRIWTVRHEIPFAGHPSLGTAVAVALARGEREVSYVQETGAGLQGCDVTVAGEASAHASMLQEPATFGAELDPEVVLRAAGIDVAHADPSLPPQLVGTGVPQVVAPVAREGLRRLRPDFDACRELIDGHSAVVMYLAAVDGERAHARSILPGLDGMIEDPATGSAVGPLMAYLHERRGIERLRVEQGVEMGRPSVLECSVEGDRVRVGGDCVVVATGTVRL
ncbi:MAG: PhzF family phenazine biosynthesis protein [Actinomycetota bacterium]|nr:PhzF family phenazine biosynthesis protein [Actinomycetota bacterium]